MSRVLVVVNLDDPQSELLKYAFETYPSADHSVLHVIDPRTRPREYLDAADVIDWLRGKRNEAAELEARETELAGQYGVKVTSCLVYGLVGREVLDRIGQGSFDQLVIGRRSPSKWGPFGRGLERLIRRTTIPTTVFRFGSDRPFAVPPESVLVPIDGSRRALNALTFACTTFPMARITVLTVIDVIPWTASAVEATMFEALNVWNADALADWQDSTVEDAEFYLERAQKRADELSVDLETVRTIGVPSREIIRHVEEGAIDHLVMGRAGENDRSNIERIVLGSTTEDVFLECRVPMTVVPEATQRTAA